MIGSAGAEEPAPSVKRYQWTAFRATDSELPGEKVWALAMGREGALWVGTSGGLARLHEGAWEVYTAADSGLPGAEVSALAMGRDGELWVGTDGGLARLRHGTWEVYTAADIGLPGDDVSALAMGTDGALWVGTRDGLARLHHGAWDVYTAGASGLSSDDVSALTIGMDGALWVGTGGFFGKTGGGLARLHDGAWDVYTAADIGLQVGVVRALTMGTDGSLWVGAGGFLGQGGGGLARLHDGAWEVYTAANSGLPSDDVWALAMGADGALWVGTLGYFGPGGGLARVHEGAWQVYSPAEIGLPGPEVSALAMGRDGSIWVGAGGVFGTDGGLSRLHDGAPEVYTAADVGLLDGVVRALAIGKDGALWVGTGGFLGKSRGGLARLHEGTWKVYAAAEIGLRFGVVQALATGRDGALWVGAGSFLNLGGGGLARLHEGKWEVYTAADSGLLSDEVSALAMGTDGALWVGTKGGLARLHQGAWEVYTAADSGLPGDDISALAIANDGALWVGTRDGLARLHEDAWKVYTAADSALPSDEVAALAMGTDGALWVGTNGGLARLQQGAWEVYTAADSGLPSDEVAALAMGTDGALWIVSGGGLARFEWNMPRPKVIKIAAPEVMMQRQNTFAVRSFDPTYRSEPRHFRYEWRVERKKWQGSLPPEPVSAATTRSPYYTISFPEDGAYAVRVTATDRYGRRSDAAEFNVNVETPNARPWLEWLTWAGGAIGGASLLYMIALGPLLLLYPRAGWARPAVNSGAFSHFPGLHNSLLSSGWARRRLFKLYADRIARAEEIAHYMHQAVSPAGDRKQLPLARSEDPLGELRARGRYLLVLGRSGTGKSVLLHRIHRLEAARFRIGRMASLPVLLDAPTHLGEKGDLADALKDALRRDGRVELPEDVLDFLIRKGGFLVLVDSLNELGGAAEVLKPFLNRDAGNTVLMASQTDVLRRQDVAAFSLVEVAPEQAAAYLDSAVSPGTWDALAPGLQALTRNPQDLALIAEVAGRLGPGNLPSRRAALYAAKVEDDSALREWVATADPRMGVVYALAFRMLAERRVLNEPTLAEWVREALAAYDLKTDEVDAVASAVRGSRLFREDVALDRLGRSQFVLAFDHELIGAFLAARHVRVALAGPEGGAMLDLAEQERWQEVFFFVVDELAAADLSEALLYNLLTRGGDISLRIVAYAIESKRNEYPSWIARVERAYGTAKLHQDLSMTPAS